MTNIEKLLGSEAETLLGEFTPKIWKESLILPGVNFIQSFEQSDRSEKVIQNLKKLYGHGRLANTGYLSILPVDQGIEHSANASFTKNPLYFDPANIFRLAIEAGCSAVATTFGAVGIVQKMFAWQIPVIVKINHNELMSVPQVPRQIMFGSVQEAYNMGASAVGATVYFWSETSREELIEVAQAFEQAHSLGMATILWCYVRNNAFKKDGVNYETATDLTSQAVHLGVTIKADIIKQKMADCNGGFSALVIGKEDKNAYEKHIERNPIDMCRYQVMNCYAGRIGLINSGGPSVGDDDLAQVVRTAVINKRAGGHGLIVGRKAFQKPMKEWIELIQAIQDVYLDTNITIA
jgi:class I fructose-bisphosphate aldolase